MEGSARANYFGYSTLTGSTPYARKDRDLFADLVVRIAGYSVYFVDLPKMMQDEIIDRTEQGFH